MSKTNLVITKSHSGNVVAKDVGGRSSAFRLSSLIVSKRLDTAHQLIWNVANADVIRNELFFGQPGVVNIDVENEELPSCV